LPSQVGATKDGSPLSLMYFPDKRTIICRSTYGRKKSDYTLHVYYVY
jgi:hypothetical protein